jgi:chemosensory pili system protein ChpA (sensor histidine kinase/response regulator)
MQLLKIPEQTPISEVDEEILEIFIEEVLEVHQEMVSNINILKDNPAADSSKKDLMRVFHTLRGSAGMVGATAIENLGLHFETLANKIIDGTISINEEVVTLLEQVKKILPNMIEQFKQNQQPSEAVILLISQAAYLVQS